jgi:hypothetical protein
MMAFMREYTVRGCVYEASGLKMNESADQFRLVPKIQRILRGFPRR